eukprot:scaffold470_cov257-Pinguiococcus_pyrenoidosus.AAC.14
MGDLETLIPATQAAFVGLLTKPKLADKLLKRPPFRFLHDVVMNSLRGNQLALDLFDEVESDSSQVSNKTAKIAFLEKVAAFTSNCTGRSLDVFHPSKVVAGMEPEGTNVFLQAFAEALRGGLDGSIDIPAAVRRTLRPGEDTKEPDLDDAEPADAKDSQADRDIGGVDASVKDAAQTRAGEVEGDFGGGAQSKGGGLDKDVEEETKDAKSRDLDIGEPAGAKAPPASRGSSRVGLRAKEAPQPRTGGMEAGYGGADSKGGELDGDIDACSGGMDHTRLLLEPVLGGRPRLTDKLLGKPPFRFLHDIISAVIRNTGFGAGLFSEEEMDSANVRDKQSKITYLEKIIRLVGMQLNTLVSARPSKIVAGHEPENTNVLLQLLGLCATKVPDSSAAVAAILGNAPEPKQPERAPGGAASSPKASEPAPAISSVAAEPEQAQAILSDAPEADPAPASKSVAPEPDQAPTLSTRPVTARRRPPRVRTNVTELEKGQETVAGPAVGILGDDDDDEDEEDIKEEPDEGMLVAPGKAGVAEDKEQHGKVVQAIMKQQQEDEEKAKTEGPDAQAKEGAKRAAGIRLGRVHTHADQKGQVSEFEIDELRKNLQMLCAAVMPLGKCMDFVTEDMATMDRELQKWRSDAARYAEKLRVEQDTTATEVEPLRLKLVDLDEQVKEQVRKVNALKAKIERNDKKIHNLLRSVSTH